MSVYQLPAVPAVQESYSLLATLSLGSEDLSNQHKNDDCFSSYEHTSGLEEDSGPSVTVFTETHTGMALRESQLLWLTTSKP